MTSDEVEVRYSRSKLIGLCSNQLTINIYLFREFSKRISHFFERDFPRKVKK